MAGVFLLAFKLRGALAVFRIQLIVQHFCFKKGCSFNGNGEARSRKT